MESFKWFFRVLLVQMQTCYFSTSIDPGPTLLPAMRAGKGFRPPDVVTKAEKTTITLFQVEHDCEHSIHRCLRAYKTGTVCARTLFFNYTTFDNYCVMDYTNCFMRYEVWQIVHMGKCYEHVRIKEYSHKEFIDDDWLDNPYVYDYV